MSTGSSERGLAWTLAAHGSELRREESAGFSARLGIALRAGHGLGARFHLAFGSSAGGEVTLSTDDPVTARWIVRVLDPATRPARWVARAETPDLGTPAARLYGRRAVFGPISGIRGADGEGWGDVLVPALRALPPGVRLSWSLAARTFRRPLLGSGAAGPSPTTHRALDAPRSLRPPANAQGYAAELPDQLLRWSVTAWATVVRQSPATSHIARVRRTLDSALVGEGGGGVRFGERRVLGGWRPPSMELTQREVASIFPTPAVLSLPRTSVVGTTFHRLAVGWTDAGDVVGPPVEPDQGRHLGVLGESGMGKSSLLVALALRASEWGGVVLMDPFGETARAIEAEVEASAGIHVVRVYAEEGTATMNALDGIGGTATDDWLRSERRLNDLVHALRRVRSGRYADSGFWGPRLEEMLTRSLRAAASLPGATLADAHTLLATGARTYRDVAPEQLGPIRELAARIRERPEDAEGARRLLFEVAGNPLLERLLCSRSPTVNPADLIGPRRIALISGDVARVGETGARYLLSVYLALVWSELIGRSTLEKTFVVLDEAQWFAHESLAEMLRLGRKRNVHVVLATQAISSLPDDVRDSVWTNVADFVAFRGSPDEARELARVAHGVTMEAVLGLPRGRAVALIGKGNASHWIRAARLPRRMDGDRRSGPTTDPPPSRPAPPPPPGDAPAVKRPESIGRDRGSAVESVLAEIRTRVATADPGSSVRVYLDELRAGADPSGSSVRAAGRRLTALGAIERAGRDARGTYWSIRSDRLTGQNPPDSPTTGNALTHAEKPS